MGRHDRALGEVRHSLRSNVNGCVDTKLLNLSCALLSPYIADVVLSLVRKESIGWHYYTFANLGPVSDLRQRLRDKVYAPLRHAT